MLGNEIARKRAEPMTAEAGRALQLSVNCDPFVNDLFWFDFLGFSRSMPNFIFFSNAVLPECFYRQYLKQVADRVHVRCKFTCCVLSTGSRITPGGGYSHIWPTGMCRPNGSLFYKKSLNMGPVFYPKNP